MRPRRRDGHGEAWATLKANHHQLEARLAKQGLTVVKAHDLLTRRGTLMPEGTLHRYVLEVLGVGRSARTTTVRVADGEPGRGASGGLRPRGPRRRSRQRPAAGGRWRGC